MIRDRVRIALIVAAALNVAVVASASDRIFDARYHAFLAILAPLVAAVICLVNPARRVILRTIPQAVGCVTFTVIAVANRHGRLVTDTYGSFVRGVARIVAVRWPAPVEPVSVGAIVLLSSISGAIVVELAWSRRYAMLLLVPPVGLIVLTALLAPKAGPLPTAVLVFVAACSALVLRLAFIARTHQRHQESPPPERGANALVASVVGLVAVLPVAVGAPFGASDRFDVRQLHTDSHQTDEEISPLSRLDEWRSIEPADDFFSVTPNPPPGALRWRIVALTRYDGRAWMPSADFRPVGERLSTAAKGLPRIRYTVTMRKLDEFWAPFTGQPVETDLSARVDSTVSGIRVTRRFGTTTDPADNQYRITVVDQPQDAKALDVAVADRSVSLAPFGPEVGDLSSVTQIATTMVQGATSDYAKAKQLAEVLKAQYRLDASAATGHSLPQLKLFLGTTKAGRDEQFVAAYALLARSIGLPARVAVGVDVRTDAATGSVARSDQVVAWPEVAFEGLGWVAFDPLPGSIVPPQAPPRPQAKNGAGAPVVPPPTTAAAADATQPTVVPTPTADSSGSLSVAARFSIVGVLLVLALIAYVVTVITMKRNRRKRRALAERPDERIAGAFLSSIDLAVDLGATARPTLTNRELVSTSAAVVGQAADPLQELGNLATRAVYDEEPPGESAADLAWEQAAVVHEQTARAAGRLRWIRAKISLRSLRQQAYEPPPGTAGPRRRNV